MFIWINFCEFIKDTEPNLSMTHYMLNNKDYVLYPLQDFLYDVIRTEFIYSFMLDFLYDLNFIS